MRIFLKDKKADSTITQKSGKGRRFIIMYDITENIPLCEKDKNGIEVEHLEWTGDTCHPEHRVDGLLTADTL